MSKELLLDLLLKYPIVSLGCICAIATTGPAAAAQPNSVMNSRRIISGHAPDDLSIGA
jgi:hypothetical protein